MIDAQAGKALKMHAKMFRDARYLSPYSSTWPGSRSQPWTNPAHGGWWRRWRPGRHWPRTDPAGHDPGKTAVNAPLWDYTMWDEPRACGDETTYRIGLGWLADCELAGSGLAACPELACP